MSLPLLINFAPLLALLVVAAGIDLKERRIPNWLTFGLILGGLSRSLILGTSGAFPISLLGMLAGAFVPFLLFIISAMGGGDVKLLAAIGAWMGPGPVLCVFLVEAVLGMLIVLAQSFHQGKLKTLFRNSTVIAANFALAGETGLQNAVDSGKDLRSFQRPLPFAVPVLFAVLIVLSMQSTGGV